MSYQPSAKRQSDPSKQVIFGMLLLPVAICWTLYGYYFIAQDLEDPAPVPATFVAATCDTPPSTGQLRGSRQGPAPTIGHVTFYLKTEYEFESRSKSFTSSGNQRAVKDRKTDYVEIGRFEDCEIAAQRANSERKATTIWAGKDDIDDRFRARFTEAREYPALALIWAPALVAGVGIRLWTRAMRRRYR